VLQKLEKIVGDVKLFNREFLRTWDYSQKEVDAVLLVAKALELLYKKNVSCRVFEGSSAVSIFRDQSTRTRSSFASATALLGLQTLDMDETKSQVAHGETVRETAAMLSFLTEVIGIRDDLFLGEGHKYMKEVSDTCHTAHAEGVLPQIPAVVNLQCDEDHPTVSQGFSLFFF
jgi:ornithine carbamoyltransferase